MLNSNFSYNFSYHSDHNDTGAFILFFLQKDFDICLRCLPFFFFFFRKILVSFACFFSKFFFVFLITFIYDLYTHIKKNYNLY